MLDSLLLMLFNSFSGSPSEKFDKLRGSRQSQVWLGDKGAGGFFKDFSWEFTFFWLNFL